MDILVYGIINSVTLSLLSLGFTLVYSISRLPNFAHGALYITTGYFIWQFLNALGLNYPLSILVGIALTAFIGAMMYRLILIRIRGMEISEIIATYAIGLAIIEGLRWGGLRGSTFTLPSFASGSRVILGVSVDDQRLLVVVVGFAVFALLYFFVHLTRNGLALRGIAQDERAAMMLGIDSDRMAIVAFAIGSSLAGLSAALILPLGNIVVEAGYNVLVFSVAVSVIGGLGSWPGAIIASFIIGFAQILTEKFLSSHFQMVIALLAIIITLLIKPSGILGRQKELEERV
ncbi:MAG TPA: branched-chain amino acid ABC transporter permease [Syntrophus sp. (in: bacteria)]|nr:MAG: branched-chain amino acid ABC transporter permease [Syntrophus sp. GWC2_56_31]HBB17199.1 branched-chain amino acid ABC transporter permease [Syntrophus sp. (in: bacteria)]